MSFAKKEAFEKYGFGFQKNEMPLAELKELVKKGESQQLEFKFKANHPDKIVKEIVAFTNSQGGKLVIGVNDDKEILGLKFAEEEQFTLLRAIEKYCVPAINYNLYSTILDNGREILIFDIFESNSKPHFVQFEDNPIQRNAYVRVNDKSVKASKEVLNVWKGKSKDKNYTFNFGPKETQLMKYLEQNGKISLTQYQELTALNKIKCSSTLVLLTLANVLDIIPGENVDFFVLKNKIA